MIVGKTHGAFEDILATARPEIRSICEALRHLIGSLHTGFVEVVWPRQRTASFGIGPKKMSEHYAYIAVQRAHVTLGFYHGASLVDPEKLLEGSGKKLRHIKVRGVALTRSPVISDLLQQAIQDRKQNCA